MPRRLPGRYQMLASLADKVRTSHLLQRLSDNRPVVRIVITQERLVQAPL